MLSKTPSKYSAMECAVPERFSRGEIGFTRLPSHCGQDPDAVQDAITQAVLDKSAPVHCVCLFIIDQRANAAAVSRRGQRPSKRHVRCLHIETHSALASGFVDTIAVTVVIALCLIAIYGKGNYVAPSGSMVIGR